MGHIEPRHAGRAHLVPQELPSRIGNLLDISLKDLEKVLYCEAYIVTDPGDTTLEKGAILTEETTRR
jgi:DNA-directed RNA polymerase subunit beta'